MKRFVFCVLFGAVLFAPGAANAVTCAPDCTNTFNYQFVFQGESLTVNLSGQLTASATQNSNAPFAGGFDIQSINGNVTISGLYDYSSSISLISPGLVPIKPVSPPSPVSYFAGLSYDNVLYYPQANFGNALTPIFGYFDQNGIMFRDDAGTYFNIFTDVGTGDPIFFFNLDTGLEGSEELLRGSVSPVPELSTWAMLLIGFAALGLIAFRHSYRAAHSLV
jgi:hypothetical protein